MTIEELIQERRDFASGKYSKLTGWALRARENRDREVKLLLATEFGFRHGWRLSHKEFGLRRLADRSNGRRHVRRYLEDGDVIEDEWNPPGPFDHNFFYREPIKPYRPAAIATHPYDYESRAMEFAELADRYGLSITKVNDFPSWWYPGWTTLVLAVPL